MERSGRTAGKLFICRSQASPVSAATNLTVMSGCLSSRARTSLAGRASSSPSPPGSRPRRNAPRRRASPVHRRCPLRSAWQGYGPAVRMLAGDPEGAGLDDVTGVGMVSLVEDPGPFGVGTRNRDTRKLLELVLIKLGERGTLLSSPTVLSSSRSHPRSISHRDRKQNVS